MSVMDITLQCGLSVVDICDNGVVVSNTLMSQRVSSLFVLNLSETNYDAR